MRVKVIAFYLPQYHPIHENDAWWGPGFTEWTNVGKAKPFFRGHHQPKVPADLGYYDLRLPDVREAQAKLAADAGIYGFCYWHYWFGNGKRLLERPFNEVLNSGSPDFPFCLGWANESWQSKEWGFSKKKKDVILINQTYSVEDYKMHFSEIIPALKDRRYIMYKGKPMFFIYRPMAIPDLRAFIDLWNSLAVRNGFPDGLYFVAQVLDMDEYMTLKDAGPDAFTFSPNTLMISSYKRKNVLYRAVYKQYRRIMNKPLVIPYRKAMNDFNLHENVYEEIIPTILPNWDHSPRSGRMATVLKDSNPRYFREHVEEVLKSLREKGNPLIFLKSWNEWGEGNYLEPDLEWRHGYLDALKDALASFEKSLKGEPETIHVSPAPSSSNAVAGR